MLLDSIADENRPIIQAIHITHISYAIFALLILIGLCDCVDTGMQVLPGVSGPLSPIGKLPMSKEALIELRSLRSIPLHEERAALINNGKRLEREIANGVKGNKGQAWIDSKNEKLSLVTHRLMEVITLMQQGRYSRHRAMGSDNGFGAKNEAWLDKCQANS